MSDLIGSLLSILTEWITYLIDALKLFVDWLLEWVCELITPIVGWLVTFIPTFDVPGADYIGGFMYVANQWVPIPLLVSLIGAYFVWIAVLWVIRSILTAIP